MLVDNLLNIRKHVKIQITNLIHKNADANAGFTNKDLSNPVGTTAITGGGQMFFYCSFVLNSYLNDNL